MKHFISIISFLFCFLFSKSQTISPSQNNEYCPKTEYTFTVTISKQFSNIIGLYGAIVTQTPTPPVGSSFTFKGKFDDVNQKQAFKVTFTDNTTYEFGFKKIKSLFFTSSCTPIQPTPAIITAPRCQVSSIPLSFSNIQWSTAYESPSLCFGSITTYEYLLPSGWKLGTTTSNGTTWIAGGNSVTITSDLSTGAGSAVKVRPTNACGAGLVKGEEIQIPISRPRPTLSIA